MRRVLKYFFLSIISLITMIVVLVPEDPAWVKCSDENDLYRYVYNGWKVDKVLKNGDINFTDKGQKLYFKGEYPQIFLSKDDRIKALNFGWRCYYLEGEELNYEKKMKK